ncbi:MAG: ammonium transporter [Planctomycetota bacterium]|nr:ammonium transporter [Planctomycetota bacterium]
MLLLFCLCRVSAAWAEDAKSGTPAPEPAKTEAKTEEAKSAAPAPDPHVSQDPTGGTVGGDYGPEWAGAAKPGEPTMDEMKAQILKLRGGLNLFWTCLAGFLVFFMQAGFAMVETGFTRAKNAAHCMGMNMMVFVIGFIGYYICGFALMFGGFGALGTLGGANLQDGMFKIGDWGICGTKGFFMHGFFDSQVLAFYMFQMVFMDTAATIPTGSMAERIKWSAFVWMSFFITMVTYPLVGCWVWGGGWLAQIGAKWGWGMGAIDFSGSGVIHMVGGWTALAGAIVLGPRIGKFDKKGNARAIPGHDVPMAVIGTIILFFGWFGFNPGSTLAATDGILSVAAVNTMIAGVFGGFSSMLYMMHVHQAKKPDVGMMCNGILAGLVAITAPCAFVSPTASVIIGVTAGVLVVLAVVFVENTLKIDDPVGAFSVHGVNGLFGVLAVGLFACGTYGAGLNGVPNVHGKFGVLGMFPIGALDPETPWFYMGQMKAQLFYGVVDALFVFGLEFAFFKVYHAVWGLRVSEEDEIAGLDVPEMGTPAYPDFTIRESHAGVAEMTAEPAPMPVAVKKPSPA